MHKDDKERVVAELTASLRATEALIVTDYRGLTMPQVDALRGRLIEHGAKFTVVKNTLTRRAAAATPMRRSSSPASRRTTGSRIDCSSNPVRTPST